MFSRARSILIPRGNFSLLIDPVTRVIPKHEDGIWPSLVYVARTFVKLDARETPVSRDLSDRRNPIAGTELSVKKRTLPFRPTVAQDICQNGSSPIMKIEPKPRPKVQNWISRRGLRGRPIPPLYATIANGKICQICACVRGDVVQVQNTRSGRMNHMTVRGWYIPRETGERFEKSSNTIRECTLKGYSSWVTKACERNLPRVRTSCDPLQLGIALLFNH